MTEKHFVKVVFDVKRTDPKPVDGSYRVYVNDELFTQRRWVGKGFYLEEMLQINAPPGKYKVSINSTPDSDAEFKASAFRVVYGPGKVNNTGVVDIVAPRD